MTKRQRSDTASCPVKRIRTTSAAQTSPSTFNPIKIATAEAGEAANENPPLPVLLKSVEDGVREPVKGECVVYWMRMADLRVADNRALSLASAQALKDSIPLIVIFIFSPQDYVAHDRSARRIDFTLRNLRVLHRSLGELDIPLHTVTVNVRRELPLQVVELLTSLRCTNLFANIEYEVDELRRDIKVCALAKDKGIKFAVSHDKCIIEPGVLFTNSNTSFAVYGAYHRKWKPLLNGNLKKYLGNNGKPHRNHNSVRQSARFGPLFACTIPTFIEGFELQDSDKESMELVWPAGEAAAAEILRRFINTRGDPELLGASNPLAPNVMESVNMSRMKTYNYFRDRAGSNSTSRLSPYLSAGVISIRECLRATMRATNATAVDATRETGLGRWNQELAWRDFYTNVLASWPRVGMGRPWLEKYSEVVWEDAEEVGEDGQLRDSKELQAWKDGMTGYPIVDSGMRCLKQMGWLHNRLRMITAMFLTKHLMIDWRVGERHYMKMLIDGDLASNNGGWQWCASTGVDPCPYFRIFNPWTQSAKADETGVFIRHFVPELRSLKTKDIHHPSIETADALGYPRPIVDHAEARKRALRRLKNIGEA
ncbi:DNA photolyase, FAD-binding/Cryptochrome [Mucidula mucida]|nr:DNA photolyase, FAD-binding/Cryptochrome [Mucidula mucida]